MLINFKVASDSPALEVEKQQFTERSSLQGINAFKIQGIR